MTHGGTTKPLINALLQPAEHAIPPQVKRGVSVQAARGFPLWRGRDGDRLLEVTHRSPSLVSHAPRLSHAALLPHFDHACEGLHARLPLGDQRDLPLHTHVGPGRKMATKRKYSRCLKRTVVWLHMRRCLHSDS